MSNWTRSKAGPGGLRNAGTPSLDVTPDDTIHEFLHPEGWGATMIMRRSGRHPLYEARATDQEGRDIEQMLIHAKFADARRAVEERLNELLEEQRTPA